MRNKDTEDFGFGGDNVAGTNGIIDSGNCMYRYCMYRLFSFRMSSTHWICATREGAADYDFGVGDTAGTSGNADNGSHANLTLSTSRKPAHWIYANHRC